MWWAIFWAAVAAVGVLGTVASVNGARFGHRVAREMRELAAAAAAPPPIDRVRLAVLPPPVRRYLTKAIGERAGAPSGVRLHHAGSFRPSLTGSWLPIRGEQCFTAHPPAFVWRGRVRMAPGVWIDARDRSVNGIGNMLVRFESTITIANASGPELDQGALVRLLGELVWLPTAFLDERYVRWSAIDERRARATLQINGRTAAAEFTFGPDDLPAAFTSERYRDLGGGKSALTTFVGRLSDFRAVDGILVPHRVAGGWVIDGEMVDYANFEVVQLRFASAAQERLH
jgi:hypothetical protein